MQEVGCVRRCPPLSKPTVGFPPLRRLAWAEGLQVQRRNDLSFLFGEMVSGVGNQGILAAKVYVGSARILHTITYYPLPALIR
ncbi:aspartate aminotransferase [Gloeocapsa sp. PCC 7428]|uniref:hypothetical protein n=1 Tax=Gloeocapsa sp. PCC 7428 TaxID=1173026 RepID=UPI0002A5E98C|nr:hypothetical protein [Gloeocapsa sp. PCC 7428]AFZ31717.1 aspartate aminotransferase [Gloeocapsa sp. PCC 7428]